MLASELIRSLQASIEEYGDLPVLDYQGEDEVSDVEYNDDEEPVFIVIS